MKPDTDLTTQNPNPKPFRFKGLKVYSSTEWLNGNSKKYRQVFDRYDTTYIYAELSLFNKNFDVEDWSLDATLKCFSVTENNKELCSISVSKNISKYQNVAYIREGWGNKEYGTFWKKGTYYWEVWIDGKKEATKFFYVEEHGDDDGISGATYAELRQVGLYQSTQGDTTEDDRVYLSAFDSEDTEYVYVDVTLENTNPKVAWNCELIFKFYTETKELKGQVSRLVKVAKDEEWIRLNAGWGSTSHGSWREGFYSVELIMMDEVLATVEFEMGDSAVEGAATVWVQRGEERIPLPEVVPEKSLEQLMADLHAMIGLETLKKQIMDHATYIRFVQLRKKKGFKEKESMSLHAIYTGNPGTGKTTIAQSMGQIYKQMGLLSKGHVHEVDRVDLVGEFIGQTAPKVKEAIKKARGGVLFIDEAYALARMNDDSKDFGREALEILIKEMGTEHNDLVVIAAGYPKEMEHLVASNPGLKSRFKHFYHFPDYLPQELVAIAHFAAERKEVVISPSAEMELSKSITEAFRNRTPSFGNARFVFDLIEKAKINMGLRLMAEESTEAFSNEKLSKLEVEDVLGIRPAFKVSRPHIPVDEVLLERAFEELNALIGLSTVKKSILELVDVVRYYRRTGGDVLNAFFLHTVFVGKPGTGKTTVARILAKMYKALGILERGHMVETDRQGLVGQYIGQTAIKTTQQIDKAQGGVLFIDEAYALSGVAQNDYGSEAVQTLLKRMEDDRGAFFVFAAGYPSNMNRFLKSNPGLKSRFDRILVFEDYSPTELLSIAENMLKKVNLVLSTNAKVELEHIIDRYYLQRDQSFGNAREVRKLCDQIISNQRLRCARADDADKLQADMVEVGDLPHGESNEEIFHPKRIGF